MIVSSYCEPVDKPQIHTNTVDLEFNFWAQELVPFVNGVDQIATAFKGAGAAEGMCERGIGCEVSIDRFSLKKV
jgi:hypothetical protein